MKLLFRTEGNQVVGLGHVVRSIGLAQEAAARSMRCWFAVSPQSSQAARYIKKAGFETLTIEAVAGTDADAGITSRVAAELGAEWLMLDGYAFSASYQDQVASSRRVSIFDDFTNEVSPSVALVINQNPGAPEVEDHPSPTQRVLRGTSYVVLRSQFRHLAPRETVDEARNVLVTLGGGDVTDELGHVIEAVGKLDNIRLKVVGSSAVHIDRLRQFGDFEMTVDAEGMADLMTSCDVAISAAGTTLYELAACGTPTLALILADNQSRIAFGLAEAGTCWNLGGFRRTEAPFLRAALVSLITDVEGRRAMSKKGQDVIDGKGASRIIDALEYATERPA